MVFNWKEQVNKCLEANELIFSFNASAMEKEYLRILVAKRMSELGKTDLEIEEWLESYDPEYPTYCLDLYSTYGVLTVSKKVKWPKDRDWTFYITDGELNFINGLDCSLDEKKFLLGVISVAKIMKIKIGLPACNARTMGYAWYIVSGRKDYKQKYSREGEIVLETRKDVCKRVQKTFKKLKLNNIMATDSVTSRFKTSDGIHEKKKSNVILKADWIDYNATSGHKVEDIEEDVKKIADEFLKEKTKICTCCGKEFVCNSKTKRDICLDCWKKQENIRKHGEKKERVETFCTQCGKIFLKSSKTKRTLCDECYKIDLKERQKKAKEGFKARKKAE